ncbi:peptidoglycan D,D-transpeptidase FtsI family protein [Dermabacteraceae bacterium P13095]
MNKTLRNVWLVVTVLFLALFASSTYFQVIAQDSLNNDSRNARTIYNEFGKHRGPIVVAGNAIAESEPVNDAFGYQRTYPGGAMYAPVTGYYSVIYGSSGIERALNPTLSGEADSLFYQRIRDLLSGRKAQGASVELTLDPKAQQAAWDALGNRHGSVVALDAETGAVLAMVSKPSYDPNLLAGHKGKQVRENWQKLNSDPAKPLINRAVGGDLYPPGSTFKLIVAAAALEDGNYTPQTQIPGPARWKLPQTNTELPNHPGPNPAPCGTDDSSSLSSALQQSCNTSFAQLGVKLGQGKIDAMAKKFGFGEKLNIPLTVTPSSIAKNMNQPQLALASIGQYEDRVTPLQVAMISAGIANDGRVMAPQLVSKVRTADLNEISALTPKELSQPLSASHAAQMREMMEATVNDGTGRAARLDGVVVGGKTGTAEWQSGKQPHAWFTGYGISGNRKIAVAVVVEEGGYGGDAAAPIAKEVLRAVMKK